SYRHCLLPTLCSPRGGYIRVTLTIKFTTIVVVLRMPTSAPSLRCRQIAENDIPAVAALLARGFHHRNQQFWLRALAQLTRREPPPGLPKYGYLLESGGVAVGALLLICSMVRTDGTAIPRCNLSSWYVEPTFRTYAALLVSQALRHKDVTYLNVSPAPHTLPIIEAQGFARYCDGVFIAVPMLNGLFATMARKSSARSVDPMSPSIPSSRSCCSSMPRSAASVCG